TAVPSPAPWPRWSVAASEKRLLDDDNVVRLKVEIGFLTGHDAAEMDDLLRVLAVRTTPLDPDRIRGAVGQTTRLGDRRQNRDAVAGVEFQGSRLLDLAEAEHPDGVLQRLLHDSRRDGL